VGGRAAGRGVRASRAVGGGARAVGKRAARAPPPPSTYHPTVLIPQCTMSMTRGDESSDSSVPNREQQVSNRRHQPRIRTSAVSRTCCPPVPLTYQRRLLRAVHAVSTSARPPDEPISFLPEPASRLAYLLVVLPHPQHGGHPLDRGLSLLATPGRPGALGPGRARASLFSESFCALHVWASGIVRARLLRPHAQESRHLCQWWETRSRSKTRTTL